MSRPYSTSRARRRWAIRRWPYTRRAPSSAVTTSPWTSQIRRLRSRSGSAVQAAIPGRDRMPMRRGTVSPGHRSARAASDQPGRGRWTLVDGVLSVAWLVLVVVMACSFGSLRSSGSMSGRRGTNDRRRCDRSPLARGTIAVGVGTVRRRAIKSLDQRRAVAGEVQGQGCTRLCTADPRADLGSLRFITAADSRRAGSDSIPLKLLAVCPMTLLIPSAGGRRSSGLPSRWHLCTVRVVRKMVRPSQPVDSKHDCDDQVDA